MAEKSFHLEIVTPRRIVYNAPAVSFSAPGTIGGFQVLYNHAPLVSSLRVGDVKVIEQDGKEIHYATSGGFVEVRDNRVTLLAETAERSDEIDVARAQAAHDRAAKRLSKGERDVDVERARAALARALNRLRISEVQ